MQNEIQVIETDFQPAAQIALWAHAAMQINPKKKIHLFVIVGEGRSHDKIPLVMSFYKLIRERYSKAYVNITIIEGISSDQDFPVDVGNNKPKPENEILQMYSRIYNMSPTVAYMMKPPREAILTKVQCPNTIMYAHGGFDWTRLISINPSEFQALTTRYKAFYYFNVKNVIGEKNVHQFFYKPNIYTHLIDPILTFISRSLILWNFQIISQLDNDINNTMNPIEKENMIKSLKAVQQCGVHQFIVNYSMLIFCTRPDVMVEFRGFNHNREEMIVPSANSKFFVFDESGSELRRVDLISKLMDLNNSFTTS